MNEYEKSVRKAIGNYDKRISDKFIEKALATMSIDDINDAALYNMGLVFKIAPKLVEVTHLPLEDLYSIGFQSLRYAIEIYDPAKGSFSTIATQVIKSKYKQIIYLNNMDKRKANFIAESLNAPRLDKNNDDEGAEKIDFLEDTEVDVEKDAIEGLQKKEVGVGISEILSCLTRKEREIIEGRYGIKGSPITLDELAKKYGLTRERVRQIEGTALTKLRNPKSVSKLLKYNEFDEEKQ